MTIDEVYRLVQTFANKEQRGFIAPSEFNLLAKQAELELYNKRLSIVKEKAPTKRSQGIYGESLSPELARQDIATFLVGSQLTVENKTASHLGGSFSLVSDYIESMFINSDEEHSISTNVPVDIVEPKDVNQILRSSLVKPSMEYPIALLGAEASGSSKVFSIFPESVGSVTVYHYRNLNTPKWNYVTIGGKPVYNHSGSNGFKLSFRCHGEIVVKILEYLGVSIREPEVVQYAQSNEIKSDS
jgi:hypothetical protein